MKMRAIRRTALALGLAAMMGCEDGSYPDIPEIRQDSSVLSAPLGTYSSRAIAAADMDDDGRIDLLTADRHGYVFIHYNYGNNDFRVDEKPIMKIPLGTYSTRAFAAADMNYDGEVDIIATNRSGEVFIHYNQGNLTFN